MIVRLLMMSVLKFMKLFVMLMKIVRKTVRPREMVGSKDAGEKEGAHSIPLTLVPALTLTLPLTLPTH